MIQTLVRRLAERFDDPRPLMITGASGSGKSSLLRAGLVTAIGRGQLEIPGSAEWPIRTFAPVSDLIAALAAQLADLAGVSAGDLAAQISADPLRLPELALPSQTRLVLAKRRPLRPVRRASRIEWSA